MQLSQEEIATVCLSLQGMERLGCFHGFGQVDLGQFAEHPRLLSQRCSFGSIQDQHMCIEGAAESLSTYYGKNIAYDACKGVLDVTLQRLCYNAALHGIGNFEKPFDLYIE